MKYPKYPNYMDSGVEWIGEIPEGWRVVRLKRLVREQLKYGANESAEMDEKLLPRYIRITDFDEGGKLRSDTFKSLPTEKAKGYYLKEGDILFARSGATVGKTFQFKNYNGEACFAGYLIKASPDESKIISDFVYLFTKSKSYENWKNSIFSQATIQNIGADKYQLLPISLPPLPEQRTIATFLDRRTSVIDSIIEKKRRQIELLKEKRTALITKAVTKGLDPDVKMKDSGIEWLGEIPEHWDVVRLNSIGNFSKGSGVARSDIIEEGHPAMSYGDIYTTYDIKIEEMKKFISEEKSKSAVPIYNGDVLMTGSGETVEEIGKAVVYLGKEKAFAGGDIIIFRHKSHEGLFLSYSLNSAYSIYQKSREAKGNIIIHTYASNLRELLIPLPPYNEQKEISSYLENYSNLVELSEDKINNSISKLQEYRSALITAAVTGKIDVREEVPA